MKAKRQEAILAFIKQKVILTQEDLQEALENAGFQVTQSTVSRDMKELRIVKGHDENGVYRYLATQKKLTDTDHNQFQELFRRSAKSVQYAINNIVIKCYTGMAQTAAVAVDELFGERMLGSLAGDDTVLIVTADETSSASLAGELKNLL